MSKLILPKVYQDRTKEGKYEKHNGKPKLSYSQYSSWKSPLYRPGYIKRYLAGINLKSGVFADFGSEVGEYKEWLGNGKVGNEPISTLLSLENKEFLQSLVYPENSVYEDLIVVDCGDFVIEGYIDRCVYLPESWVDIEDFKTGSIEKKKSEYASPDYGQTTLYSYQKKQEGFKIRESKVTLFDRKGNNSAKSPLRLTGEIEHIPTPYSDERAEKLLKDMTKVANEISDYYQQYVKLFM